VASVVVQMMFIFAVFYVVYQIGLKKIRCRYCGKVNHEEHCPYAGSGQSGGQ
jgi:hypothetical protein